MSETRSKATIGTSEELGIREAAELERYLEEGVAELERETDKYKEFNPENGWGSYEGLVDFVRSYIAKCREFPRATVKARR